MMIKKILNGRTNFLGVDLGQIRIFFPLSNLLFFLVFGSTDLPANTAGRAITDLTAMTPVKLTVYQPT